MEKRLLIFSCIILFIISIVVGFVPYRYPGLHRALAKQSNGTMGEESVSDLLGNEDLLVDTNGDLHNLRMEFPWIIKDEDIQITPDYIEQSLEINFKGTDELYLMEYPIAGDGRDIRDINFTHDGKTGTLSIKFERTLVTLSESEGNFLYLDFKEPKEIYEKIVVLDAGHGGSDNGAEFAGVAEKDINLAIVKEIYSGLTEKHGDVGVFCTRDTDDYISQEDRVKMANGFGADVFISVHQNSTSSGRLSDIDGTEVMYFSAQKSGESKALSGVISKKLERMLGSRNRGLVPGDDILILRNFDGACALVEVGFITNNDERAKLVDPGYQKACADGIVEGIMEYLK